MNFPNEPNHKHLLAAARAGDPEARGQLLELYRAYLTLLARLEIDRRLQDKADPADLVQETLLDAHQDFAQFQGRTEKEFLSWLRQVLLSKIANRMRCYRDTQCCGGWVEHTLAEELETASHLLERGLFARQSSSGQRTVCREQAVLLADALEQLPDADREVIILRHLEGLTLLQVADRMGLTMESVKKQWASALARLGRILREW